MNTARRVLLIAIPLALLGSASAPQAAPKRLWDGVWSGQWDHQYDTTVTIARNRVVGYTYRGYDAPIGHSKVTASAVTFGKGFTVTLTRTSDTTASAAYHGANGDSTGELTKQ